MRINKYLASCGIASRRNSEQFILSGKVKLNGRVVVELGTDVGVDDIVTVDEKVIKSNDEKVYLMFNKPKGCVTTVADDRGRKTVFDYIDAKVDHLFPVGRLDYDTEGLLLLTNDGDFANLLTHPSSGIDKTYVAKIEGKILESELRHLENGVMLDGRLTNSARVQVLDYDETYSRVEVVISEGRNRQVRRMFEAIGRTVDFLKRTQVGALKLGGLSRGEYRPLTEREIGYFLISSDKTKRLEEIVFTKKTKTFTPQKKGGVENASGIKTPSKPYSKKLEKQYAPKTSSSEVVATPLEMEASKPYAPKPYTPKPYTPKPYGSVKSRYGTATSSSFGAGAKKSASEKTGASRPKTYSAKRPNRTDK